MNYYPKRGSEDEVGPRRLAEFDPADMPLPKLVAATYAPFRSEPVWKTYTNVGHAKNAMKHHRYIIRYDWTDQGWQEVEPNEGQIQRRKR